MTRLLEFAPNYFDLKDFKDGETKRALMRVANKRSGSVTADGVKKRSRTEDERNNKRVKSR